LSHQNSHEYAKCNEQFTIDVTVARDVVINENPLSNDMNNTDQGNVSNEQSVLNSDNSVAVNPADDLVTVRKSYPKNVLMAYLNVNSIRYKIVEVEHIMRNSNLNIFGISETKIDSSFPDKQFQLQGYNMFRKDRTCHGGGLLVYVQSHILCRRRMDLETSITENITLEVNLGGKVYYVVFMYRPPKLNDSCFDVEMTTLLDKLLSLGTNIFVIGDLNYDLLYPESKGKTLSDIIDLFNLKNTIKTATCHTKNCNSLLDVILTTTPRSLATSGHMDVGISDCHDLVYTVMKRHVRTAKPFSIKYRSFKYFNEDLFLYDLAGTNFDMISDALDVNTAYSLFVTKLNTVVDRHAPIKVKTVKANRAPFMNSKLRRAINAKRMLYRKYTKRKSKANWAAYKTQRNLCTSLRRKSMCSYLKTKCSQGKQSKDFWKTVKPLLSRKDVGSHEKLCLLETGGLASDDKSVCNILNDYFTNIASSFGSPDLLEQDPHPSLTAIEENCGPTISGFKFTPVNEGTILKKLMNVDTKKATGHDKIAPKILKMSARIIAKPITALVNMCIQSGTFIHSLKLAQITPVYKKGDILSKANYRPVSILPTLSKLFEGILADQLSSYMDPIFNPMLSGFRRGFGCHSVLTKLIEDWKAALDKRETVGVVLLDMSKAFDSIDHALLLKKLPAYGVDELAVRLIGSYLSDRKQQVKIRGTTSDWKDVLKGVPQGSVIGPLLFNIFTNDIFYCIKSCDLYNFADDNSLSAHNKCPQVVSEALTRDIQNLLTWCKNNGLVAHPDKLQFMTLGPKAVRDKINVKINNKSLTPEDRVKLLGLIIDNNLKFGIHVKTLCQKAGCQLNALSRLRSSLDMDSAMSIYKTFVLSNFNYTPTVWHFCGQAYSRNLNVFKKGP
jgi:exonuclease III